MVVLDDIGNDLIGVYGEGPSEEQPPTPNMDALAAAGIVFENAYANPSCSPTRASLMTGLFASRTGIGSAIASTESTHLSFKHLTIPEALRRGKSGHLSVMLGKWHLGTAFGMLDPVLHGFDAFVGTEGNLGDHFDYSMHISTRGGFHRSFSETTYSATRTTNDAINAVQMLPEPWFLWVNYHLIHKPLHRPPQHLHSQFGPLLFPIEEIMAMTEAVDTELGRLLRNVDLCTTTVVVLGDNGGKGGITSSTPEGRGKSSLYEGGVNVPLIVAGEAIPMSQRGEVCEGLVTTADLFSTIADLAGVNPAELGPLDVPLDSVSFAPLLRNPGLGSVRDYAYSETFKPNEAPPFDTKYKRMIRDGSYKYVRNVVDRSKDRFHDLTTAAAGQDGPDLCPCPDELSPAMQDALQDLMQAMDTLAGKDLVLD
jgi:arylsulfatase A-like enzyme